MDVCSRAMIRVTPPSKLLAVPRLRPWWLLAASAAFLVAAGIYLTWLDGRGTCDVPGVTCPRAYRTAGLGTALWVAGVASLVLGLCVRQVRAMSAQSGPR